MQNEKAILIAGYGTSYIDQFENVILKIKKVIEANFKDYDVLLCFTSQIIINRLNHKNSIVIYNIEEALNDIKDKYKTVIVQPLHLITGVEYEKVIYTCKKYEKHFDKLVVGEPIFYDDNDYEDVVNVVSLYAKLNKSDAILLIGHGSKDYANIKYEKLQSYINNKKLNIYVDTIEEGNIYETIEKLKTNKIKNVLLTPLTLVFGYHGKIHISGESEDSIKNILNKNNYTVKVYRHGLGENDKFIDIYIKKINKSINK